jgi:DNA-binding transcriptional MerR regulator
VRIGELARRAGTSPRALRHYEEQGLLAAHRRANGYRDYLEDDLRLVVEIRSLLAIGFTLAETRPFVDCLRAGNDRGVACPAAAAVYRRKIAEIDACVARLGEIRAELAGQLADELADLRVAQFAARELPVPASPPACSLHVAADAASGAGPGQ